MGVRVSVVVPVYNPGRHIEPLIDSLAAQSLPPDEFETIFVDDGSTDETPGRLDRLAATRRNVRVIHQENSGWPGKPRNVGIDASRGDYVFFSDNDDWLGSEALERLDATARRNRADIVIGKMVGHNRGVPRVLFRRNVDRATLSDTPLIDSLTPHKLFRREFLNQAQLRFPEGKRRLEDHLFVVRAYFRADVVSVLADYPCYHHIRRDDTGNAGYSDIDPRSYYGYLRETLDVVELETVPGPLRDRLLRRFLNIEVLSRLDGDRLLQSAPELRGALFEEIRTLMMERFPEQVDAGLPLQRRLLARTVRSGSLADVERLADWSAAVHAEPLLVSSAWEGETLRLAWRARVASGSGPLVTVEPSRVLLHPPGDLGREPLEATEEFRRLRVDVVARHRGIGEELRMPTTLGTGADGTGALTITGTTVVTPEEASFGRPMEPGAWDFWLRIAALGFTANVRLGAERTAEATSGLRAAFLGDPARLALPAGTATGGNLTLMLDGAGTSPEALLRASRRAAVQLRAAGPVVSVVLRAPCTGTSRQQVRLQPRGGGADIDVAATLEPAAGGSRLVTGPVGGWSASGTYRVLLRLRDADTYVPLGVDVRIGRDGRARIRHVRPLAERTAARARQAGWRVARGLRARWRTLR